jgi:hypothetical protein
MISFTGADSARQKGNRAKKRFMVAVEQGRGDVSCTAGKRGAAGKSKLAEAVGEGYQYSREQPSTRGGRY